MAINFTWNNCYVVTSLFDPALRFADRIANLASLLASNSRLGSSVSVNTNLVGLDLYLLPRSVSTTQNKIRFQN